MKKEKTYAWAKFTPEVIKQAIGRYAELAPKRKSDGAGFGLESETYNVKQGTEKWNFDSQSEFFAQYREKCETAFILISKDGTQLALHYRAHLFNVPTSEVGVKLKNRADIESVFGVFEEGLATSTVPQPKPPPSEPWESKVRIFIGHGQDPAWRDLKDHLAERQRFAVETYEADASAGHTISENLGLILDRSTFAILILTGELQDQNGALHARDNVIHELGLFQGKLGFNHAIALVEHGVTEFSNLHGIQQVRFEKGRIREVFGEVVAAIKSVFSAK